MVDDVKPNYQSRAFSPGSRNIVNVPGSHFRNRRICFKAPRVCIIRHLSYANSSSNRTLDHREIRRRVSLRRLKHHDPGFCGQARSSSSASDVTDSEAATTKRVAGFPFQCRGSVSTYIVGSMRVRSPGTSKVRIQYAPLTIVVELI